MTKIKPIINIEDVPIDHFGNGGKFSALEGRVGPAIGAEQLGCSYTVVPTGKRAFPFHNHHINEEMMVILEGEGEYRFGTELYPVRKGDVIAAPAGGKERAHQLINTGADELRYLCMSTMHRSDIVEYPDSNKMGAMTYAHSNDDEPVFRHRSLIAEPIDYWDGEE
jgi:uncharacterized cupin superfamily protein